VIVARVKEMKGDEGYNAQMDSFENLVEAGVIDPTKVVRSALQNAASIASLLLSTEAVISEIREEKGEPAAAGCRPRRGCTESFPQLGHIGLRPCDGRQQSIGAAV
jgi:hypothetical protein